MNFPQTADELLSWPMTICSDAFGSFTVITGYEGSGACFWCGKDLEGQRRRYCGHRAGCWTKYQQFFSWPSASGWCIRRYNYKCTNCGAELVAGDYSKPSNLEAHHIIPLNGAPRAISVFNIPWNLICLCHRCHMLVHAVMRNSTSSSVLDIYELAMIRGQGVFKSLV